MLSLPLPLRVFLCTTPVDMRKGFDGLAALVHSHLGADPLSGDLFVFCGKRRDKVKLLGGNERRPVSFSLFPVSPPGTKSGHRVTPRSRPRHLIRL